MTQLVALGCAGDSLPIGLPDACDESPISNHTKKAIRFGTQVPIEFFLFLQLEAWLLSICPFPQASILIAMLKNNRKGRATKLFRALLTAGLLGSAAISALGAGPAQAAPVTWFTFNPVSPGPVQDVTFGDKLFHFLNFSSPDANGTVSIDSTLLPGDPYKVSIDFSGSPTFPLVPGSFSYDVTILQPQTYFERVDLATSVTNGALTVVTKSCSLDDLVVDPPCDRVLQVVGQGSDTLIVPQPYSKITITDAWTPVAGESITHIENDLYQKINGKPAPGPLPLFGAGAAFGFSRRIRRRIKGARLA